MLHQARWENNNVFYCTINILNKGFLNLELKSFFFNKLTTWLVAM